MGPIEPNLKTKSFDYNGAELAKLGSDGIKGWLYHDLRDESMQEILNTSEHLAKSHGIYLEFNRAKTGKERDWMYMIRITLPGGGPINREQWRVFDELSEKYTVDPDGNASLKITTRQNIQFHWVKKKNLIDIVKTMAETGFYTLNGCGDNVRNVMGCPLSSFSPIYNANAMAQEFGKYFRLPPGAHIAIFAIDPQYIREPEHRFQYGEKLLNRKFKIAFSAVHYEEESGQWIPDNCVELRTNDIGVAPIIENGNVERFQVYIGGGQGERTGKPTFSALAQPFGIFNKNNLLIGLDAIVQVQQIWGDRENRYWARMKYILYKQGIDWFRQQVKDLIGDFELPDPDFNCGDRHLHHGWMKQPSDGLLSYGAFIENGRVVDGKNGQLKKMIMHLMDEYPIQAIATANQDIIFSNIPPDAKESFEADMEKFGYGQRNGKDYSTLRRTSVACVGLDTCRLAYTESERALPILLDKLDEMGYGGIRESVGMSGCERQCSRPGTKTIGWVGSGKKRYQLRLMGTETARNQGRPIIDPANPNEMYLRSVPFEEVSTVTAALFDYYQENRQEGEGMGEFHNRVGMEVLISYLKENSLTAPLMKKTFKLDKERKSPRKDVPRSSAERIPVPVQI